MNTEKVLAELRLIGEFAKALGRQPLFWLGIGLAALAIFRT